MSCLSTFGSFTTARLAIYASQKALDVVGNNIGNINTNGYTRQCVDQVSFISGHADRYHTALDNRVGNGALVTSISQLRDPYLDIRYRTEMATVGYREKLADGYTQLSNILDEVAKGEDTESQLGVVEKQFNDLIEQMQRLVTQGADVDSFDTNVRTSASGLTKLLNSYANSLKELYETEQGKLRTNVDEVNDILSNIRDLNNSIRKSEVYGGDSLEMKDARNVLIDRLSEYIRIDVSYELEDFGPGQKVEKLVIRVDNNDQYDVDKAHINKKDKDTILIDGIYGTQLEVDHPRTNEKGEYVDAEGKVVDDITQAVRDFNDNYNVKVGVLKDRFNRVKSWYELEDVQKLDAKGDPVIVDGKPVMEKKNVLHESQEVWLTDNALYGALQAQRELLTEQGQYSTQGQLQADPNDPGSKIIVDPKANTKRGIPYYQKALDTLANQFAHIMNEANKQEMTLEADENGKLPEIPDGWEIKDYIYETRTSTEEVTTYERKEVTQKPMVHTMVASADPTQPSTYPPATGEYFSPYDIYEIEVDVKKPDGTTAKEKKYFRIQTKKGQTGVFGQTGQEYLDVKSPDPEPEGLGFKCYYYGDEEKSLIKNGEMDTQQLEHCIPSQYGGLGHAFLEEVPGEVKKDEKGNFTFSDLEVQQQMQEEFTMWVNVPKVEEKEVTREEVVGYKLESTGDVLFSNAGNGDDPTGITADNISISKSWSEGVVRINQSKDPNHPSTDNSNLDHMLYVLQVQKHDYKPMGYDLYLTEDYQDPNADEPSAGTVLRDKEPASNSVMFTGTFQEMFTENISGTLAMDRRSNADLLENHAKSADELYVDRDAISGVDLNDEAMNMMQFQKSLNAAYRLMTVIDESLERLINNTGIAGR